jgi:3-oxoacyl-[acyl-carrier-protein] synthase II
MAGRVFITGTGIFSSIGIGVEQTLDSLINGRSGIGPLKILETVHHEFPVAEIQFDDTALAKIAGLPGPEGFTRTTLMAYIAVKEALKSAGINDIKQFRTGFISATTVGGMDKKEKFFHEAMTSMEWLKYIDTQDVAEHTEHLADLFGFHDFITTASTACSSGANALMLGARMIKQGLLDRVVAGGNECLTRFHLNGFNSLMILDKEPCKPFDQNRAGITLGEGAGYLVLESEEIVKREGKKVICELSGYGNSCEAFHPTASSPDGVGAYLAMIQALEIAGLKPADIDYINAHGTGTDSNDISEGNAIQRLFAPTIPPVSSTKPYTGHTTSAAGSIEAIICTLALQHGLLFPNLNFKTQMADLSFAPVKEITHKELKHVMSNSFGFGGNNTSLIFSK